MYKVTKEFRFEMAHVLSNYNGLCGNLHGHSYKLLITLESKQLDSDEMIMDFNKIKEIVKTELVDKLDHSVALNIKTTDKFEKDLMKICIKHKKRVSLFLFRTTAENMSKYIFEKINILIKNDIKCSKVELYETTTGKAEYVD